jgi:hypothetical protein
VKGDQGHRVRIRRLRTDVFGVVDERGPIVVQWEATCVCGWRCLSWRWSDGWHGVLPVSLEHLESGSGR